MRATNISISRLINFSHPGKKNSYISCWQSAADTTPYISLALYQLQVWHFCIKLYAKWWSYELACTSRLYCHLQLLHHHHHQHVPERLGVFPVPWSSIWSWSLHLFLGHPMFLRPFGLYCSACFGSLFVSILCTCCSHFSWFCFISFTMFSAPVFPPNTLILFLSRFFIRSN